MIPVGKALVAVEYRGDIEVDEDGIVMSEERCEGCYFDDTTMVDCTQVPCMQTERIDGKNVIFKLVDMPEGEL